MNIPPMLKSSSEEPLSDTATADRSIGSLIAEARNLSADQVERVLSHQKATGMRFGEAAVALGLVTSDDVLRALSKQFHYPYALESPEGASEELVALTKPFGTEAEAFRSIRSQVIMRMFNEGQERKALAVVSPDSGDGKTYFSSNLAVTLAQLGGRTLLVDADLRGPRLHEVFKLQNKSGLSGILSGRAESKVIQQVQNVPTLFVLPGGTTPPNPLELVERPAFGLLIKELLTKFDHVIVDSPAACYGSDSAVISTRCGAALIVARKDETRVESLRDLVDDLSETRVQFIGTVFNNH